MVEFPTIETAPPRSYATLDRAIARLDSFDWIIFTSATGVESFIERMKSLRRDIRALGDASIAAIGPATAARLADYALRVAAVPDEYRAEEIVPAIGIRRIRGKRFLIPRAEVAREAMPEILRDKGAKEVVVAPAYRTVKPKGAQVERMRELIASGAIDLVTFTSSSTVTNFCELIGASGKGSERRRSGRSRRRPRRAGRFEAAARRSQRTRCEYAGARLIAAPHHRAMRDRIRTGSSVAVELTKTGSLRAEHRCGDASTGCARLAREDRGRLRSGRHCDRKRPS